MTNGGRVAIGLGKHFYRAPKAKCPDELGFGFHAVLVFCSEAFNQAKRIQKAVDTQNGVEEVPIHPTHIRRPTDGFTVVNLSLIHI